MQRRAFTRTLATVGAVSAASLGGWPLLAQAQPALKEGSDYMRLDKPAPVDAPAGQIEVLEFFAYTCSHCFNFEPLLKDWAKQKPANVVLRRMPVGFNASMEPLQRLYFALEVLGKLDTLHDKVFQSIHVERQRLVSPESMVDWAVKQGLDKAKFTEAFTSFGVVNKAKRATQLQNAYQVEATPSLGIAGRFLVPGQGARTLVVANALIAQAPKV